MSSSKRSQRGGERSGSTAVSGPVSNVSGSSRARPGGQRWEDKLKDEAFRKMTLAELKSATGNFDKRNLLGSGGFGDVYQGKGPKGQDWAVKRARPGVVLGTGTSQGMKDFEREVVTMSQLSHKHLVRLLGYCTDKGEHVVVYELMEGGSLARALHGQGTKSKSSSGVTSKTTSTSQGSKSQGRISKFLPNPFNSFRSGRSESVGVEGCETAHGYPDEHSAAFGEAHKPLSFLQRVDIATGTAEALHYLHTALQAPVVHRDIKPDNILLDSKMRAKVGDFGLVKLMKDSADVPGGAAESTRVTGTRGYVDPDYWEDGKASPAVDVYSFGVVMLELLTGRRPLVHRISDLAVMYPSKGAEPGAGTGSEVSALSGLDLMDLQKSSDKGLAKDIANGQQVPIRDWVDHVLRAKKDLYAVLDLKMDLDLGTSSRARKLREEELESGEGSGNEALVRQKKTEILEKGLKAFLLLALDCTHKTAKRPEMSEVATQLQQIRRELRAARENPT